MRSDSAIILCRAQPGQKPLLLRELSLVPAALWLARALEEAGVKRFFVACPAEWAEQLAACFPDGTVTAPGEDAAALAAFVQAAQGPVLAVTRPVWLSFAGAESAVSGQSGDPGDLGLIHVTAEALLRDGLAALDSGTPVSADGKGLALNDTMSFCLGQELARGDLAARLMAAGVRLVDPAAVDVDPTVRVGEGTVLLPGTILRGNTTVGTGCTLGPNTMLTGCTVGDGVTINSSQCEDSEVQARCEIGPYAHLRPHCVVGEGSKIGAFVQLKNCNLGRGTKMAHLTYVGDSDVGDNCNFGCGTVTCNYDGAHKFRTTIGSNVFIGCNTNLVAPVTVEDGAYTAAGTTVTDHVPADALAIGRARQTVKEGWAKRRREKNGK